VFTLVRQMVVNHIVDAAGTRVLGSLLPALVVGGSVLTFALPVRLWSAPGLPSMLAIVAAGAVGGLVGLGLSPAARAEVNDLVAKVRG
jgi:hypothetical protein